MLVTPCPKCGKPTPARLATPDQLHCDACGYAGPPPEPAREAMLAARAHLEARDVRARQISTAVRNASLRGRTLLLLLTFVVSSLPTLYFVAIVLSHLIHPDQRQLDLSTTWSAFLSLLAGWTIGAMLLAKHRRDQRKMRRLIAAVPASRVGDPAACRVCGADLPAGDAIVRCGFCGTDNYADDKAIRRLDAREASDVGAYERDLSLQTTTVAEGMAEAGKGLLVAALLLPVGILVIVSIGLEPVARHVEGTVDDSIRYSSAATRDGECIGVPVHPKSDDPSYTLDRGTRRFEPPSSLGSRFPDSFVATALVGKPVHVDAENDHHEVEATVVKVYGSPIGNLALLHTKDGRDLRVDLRDLCLDEPAAQIPGSHASTPKTPTKSGSTSAVVDDDGTRYEAKGGAIVREPPGGSAVVIFSMPQVMDGDHPYETITDLTLEGSTLTFVYDAGHSFEDTHPLAMAMPRSGGPAHVIDDMLDAKR